MDINDLFDGIMKSINQFAFDAAEQRLQEKMQDTGRGPENGGKTRRPGMAGGDSRKAGPSGREAGRAKRNAENSQPKEKRNMTDFPKRE